jgi:hypothetical protein
VKSEVGWDGSGSHNREDGTRGAEGMRKRLVALRCNEKKHWVKKEAQK